MGYTEGKGLGVRQQGVVEPLPLSLNRGRAGIGRKRPPPPPRDAKGHSSIRAVDRTRKEDFRRRLAAERTRKVIAKRLAVARRLIQDLDAEAEIERNPFWLPTDNSSDALLQGISFTDAFSAALAYLREQHAYCFWCGHQVRLLRSLKSGHSMKMQKRWRGSVQGARNQITESIKNGEQGSHEIVCKNANAAWDGFANCLVVFVADRNQPHDIAIP